MSSIDDVEKQLEKAEQELSFWESSLKNRQTHQYQMAKGLVDSLKKQVIANELAQAFGYENAEDYHRSIEDEEQFFNKSKAFYEKPSNEWPLIIFNWDYKLESQRFGLDGSTQSDFEQYYPDGLILGRMPLKEFDQYLCHFNKRNAGELWTVGSKSKLAKMIVYLSEGNPITPPIIVPLEDNKVAFDGGNHRYAVAKELGINEIFIYAAPEYVEKFNQFMNICWVHQNK